MICSRLACLGLVLLVCTWMDVIEAIQRFKTEEEAATYANSLGKHGEKIKVYNPETEQYDTMQITGHPDEITKKATRRSYTDDIKKGGRRILAQHFDHHRKVAKELNNIARATNQGAYDVYKKARAYTDIFGNYLQDKTSETSIAPVINRLSSFIVPAASGLDRVVDITKKGADSYYDKAYSKLKSWREIREKIRGPKVNKENNNDAGEDNNNNDKDDEPSDEDERR